MKGMAGRWILTFMCAGWLAASMALAAPPRWRTLENCVLIAHAANDADSFHVRYKRKSYIVRLYFVDAPETSVHPRAPERVPEQAAWFETTEAQVLHYGAVAADYALTLLRSTPFTVHTRLIDARGASTEPRVFALVEVDGRYLCELLTERGYARVHGFRQDLPDGTPWLRHVKRLQRVERDAKARRAGLWSGHRAVTAIGGGAGAFAPDPAATAVTLARDVPFYTSGSSPTFRGTLRQGDTLYLLSEPRREMVEVQAPFRGVMETGQCRRSDLGY